MIIELPETLARQINDIAAEEGVDVAAYVQRLVERTVTVNNFAVAHPLPSPQEVSHLSNDELLRRISGGPTAGFWTRYRHLARKRDAEEITPDELHELIRRADAVEDWRAERLTYLIELAHRRETTVSVLMDEMGLRPAPMA